MAINYLIGVGGVGSRIIESAVRLCECGFINVGELKCLMIDVDQSNGNANKTLDIIDDYKNCRDSLRSDNTGLEIFKTEIRPAIGSDYRITPLDGISTTRVSDIASGGNRIDRGVEQALFTSTEAHENVEAGFYGNLALGNVFYTYSVEKKGGHSPLQSLLDRIKSETANNVVKVFIAGSLFGGTGASGVAFISQKMVGMFPKGDSNRDNLHINAGLMLPYFRYHDKVELPVGKDGKPTEQKIYHDNFNKNALAALEKYQRLSNTFDRVLLLGDPDIPVRGMYSHEGSRQNNWPHVLEMFAASEAGVFFNKVDAQLVNQQYMNTEWYSNPFEIDDAADSDRNKIRSLDWECYEGYESLKKKIDDFLLFNYYYTMYITPILFNMVGGKLVSWNLDDDANDAREDVLVDCEWAKNRFTTRVSTGLFSKKRVWYNGIVADDFTNLLKYLNESAKWYFKLAYDYGEAAIDSRPCWETGETPACAGGEGECRRKGDPLLPKMFDNRGGGAIKLLSDRACMPKDSNIWSLYRFSADIASRFGRTSPELDENLSSVSGNNGAEVQRRMFKELLENTYDLLSRTTSR